MSKEESTITIIKLAIKDYYHALDKREDIVLAGHKCLNQIQNILNMQWIPGETLKNKKEWLKKKKKRNNHETRIFNS